MRLFPVFAFHGRAIEVFWKKKNSNLLLIKYEELLNNIDNEIEKIASFLANYIKIELNEFKKKNIIETTKFENFDEIRTPKKIVMDFSATTITDKVSK